MVSHATVKENTADDMMNFKVFALVSSVFVASLRVNNAVPFSGLRDEANAGEYNFCDMQVFFAAWKSMCSLAASEQNNSFLHSFRVFQHLSFTFIGTISAKIVMFWSRYKRFSQVVVCPGSFSFKSLVPF